MSASAARGRLLSVLLTGMTFINNAGSVLLDMYKTGGRIGICEDVSKFLFDDIRKINPTTLTAVPRIWHSLFSEVFSKIRVFEENSILKCRVQFQSALEKAKAKSKPEEHAKIEEILLTQFRGVIGNRCAYVSNNEKDMAFNR